MKPTPISFNGTSLQSTDYQAYWPESQALQGNVTAIFTQRSGAWPYLAGKTYSENNIVIGIICKHDFTDLFESLNALFDVQDETPHQLIVRDDSDSSSDNEYYINCTPVSPIGQDGNEYNVVLALETPIWQSVTEFSQTFSTTSTTATTDFVIGGNCEAYPQFEVTPGSASTAEYAYIDYIEVLPTSTSPWVNRPLRLGLDTQTLIGAAKMQADGDDLRVYRDDTEIDRWLDSTGLNTTDTGVWVNATVPPARTLILHTAIASTDAALTTIYVSQPVTNMYAMPNTGRLKIDSEEFVYSAKEIGIMEGASTSYSGVFTISERASRNTSAASHAAGATITEIPLNLKFVYGDAGASAPTVDDTKKPIIDLNSTNSSFTWSSFWDVAGKRSAIFKPVVQSVSNPKLSRSGIYSSTNDVEDVDPAVVMGTKIKTYQQTGTWRNDTATVYWRGFLPDKISSISAVTGEQYESSTSWPAYDIQTSVSSTSWKSRYSLGAVAASTDYGTWMTWTAASSDFSAIPANQKYIRFYHNGTVGGTATTDEMVAVGIDSITIGLTNPPTVTTRGEQADYYIDFKLANAEGEFFSLAGAILSGKTVYIDTDPEYPTVTYNGALANGMLSPDTTRTRWLAMQPGTVSLTYTTNLSAGTDISIVVRWRNRMNFL